jgi:hypothetical protein
MGCWWQDVGLSVLLVVTLYAPMGYPLMFQLQPNSQKCLREEVHKDVLVSGDYEISEVPGQTVDLHVSQLIAKVKEILKGHYFTGGGLKRRIFVQERARREGTFHLYN